MIRLFIIAAMPAMRVGLRALLNLPEVQVVGEAPSLVGLRSDLAAIDVLLVADAELLMDATRILPREGNLALLLLTDNSQPVAALRALPLRSWGLALPDSAEAELHAAVLAVAQGLIVFPMPLSESLLGQPSSIEELVEPLTSREREVLDLLGQGLSNKLIARELQISEHTVKFHLSSLFTKLGVASRTEAITRGARHGLISL
ncbi:MAG: response regulator transcription factor [Ardenticatenales bacterium]|nr:response regulator transcription factor [Ardenticatenales bacterium]